MCKRKALQLASVASMIDQFNIPNIQLLQALDYSVDVAADFSHPGNITRERAEELKNRLQEMNVRVWDISIPRTLNAVAISSAYRITKALIKSEQYDLIHCHSPIGGAICRVAARKERKQGTRVIYTAHGFHFYSGAPTMNWIIYYPIEKWLSRYTDVLITINQEDYHRAQKRFFAKQTVYSPGVGINVEAFRPTESGRNRIRAELGLNESQYMLLSVGELNANKNHQAVIRAIKGMDLVYVIAGKGKMEQELQLLAKEQGVDLRLVGFRNDVADLYSAADGYVLPSIREGLNVSLMEAMASGLPCLGSRIRGNVDLIDEGKGGYLFDPLSVGDLAADIRDMMNDRQNVFSKYNMQKIKSFGIQRVESLMKTVYEGI